ncbi:MAG TPA: DUF3073 domain-containing protein [Mycobacteriales bacterium]|nr:DUF3073 domain-containing protein [Mycobacteriales bacterium]
MGRGRAKAKQQKVARELKYSSPSTDLSKLERELSGKPVEDVGEDDELDDEYEDYNEYDERRERR